MDGADESGWSAVASQWARLWGDVADPARRAVVAATGIGEGFRVLDAGCGSGEFLALIHRLGAAPSGVDPAPGMVALARSRVPEADVRLGSFDRLPWPDAVFDVVTAFNALQFADDTLEAVAAAVRVTVPGGFVAISNWADRDRNDLDAIEAAVAHAAGDEPLPDGDLRPPGGLERLLRDAGLNVTSAGLVETPWEAADDEALVSGVLMGEDAEGMAAAAPTVIGAAKPFRTAAGGYRLVNAFRYAVGRTPAR